MNNTAKPLPSARIRSIDVFRGLTIFLMIFVNDLPSVKNITMWLKHMPMDQSGMTIPDVVFPAFLFIVGMSIPLAFKRRLERGESKFSLIKHILIRSGALIILGVLMVNIWNLNENLSIISLNLWAVLMFVSVILIWNIYPKENKKKQNLFRLLKGLGLVLLLFLVIVFRSGTEENIGWLTTSWWGILGLIGWAYLLSSICYLNSKNSKVFMITFIAMFIVLYIGDQKGVLDFLVFNKSFLELGPHLFGHAAITSLGVLLTMIFEENGFLSNALSKIKTSFIIIVLLVIAGYCLEPIFGINKVKATPSFVLYSSVICVLLFNMLYYLIDIKKVGKFFNIFNPAGSNPLLAYILPFIFFYLMRLLELNSYLGFWRDGYLGILRSIIFSFLILGITNLMTKSEIKLKL